MKVICIDGVKAGAIGLIHGNICEIIEAIYEGEIYTVLDVSTVKGIKAYSLHEKPCFTYYKASRFVTLSSIDETEMERNYNTVKI